MFKRLKNKEVKKRPIKPLEKVIKESKDFIKAIKKRDKRFKILNNKEVKKINNKEVKKKPIEPLEKVIKESKDLIKEIKKHDEKKTRW